MVSSSLPPWTRSAWVNHTLDCGWPLRVTDWTYLRSRELFRATIVKVLPVGSIHLDLVKDGAAEVVDRNARGDGVETHHGEYDEGAHAAAVLVTGYAVDIVREPGLDQLARSWW